ncbi:MAG: acyltransferase family protein [Thermoguttaceae bacterium]|nr:acyltransferase family protein [Thermoguttaceae bacterium]
MSNVSKRIDFIDTAKAIALFLVILGHLVPVDGDAFQWIFSFHMPIFFFLSGYCFNSNSSISPINYFLKKVQSLIIPYIIFCLIGIVITLFIPPWKTSIDWNCALFQIFRYAQPSAIHMGTVWFLIALFWTQIEFYSLWSLFRKCPAIIFLISFSLLYITFIGYSTYKLKLSTSFIGLFFVVAGYYSRRWQIFTQNRSFKVYLCLLLSLCLLTWISIYLNGHVNICDCYLGNSLFLFILASLSGIYFWTQLSCLLPSWKVLQYIGQNTLLLFVFHPFFITIILSIVNKLTGMHYAGTGKEFPISVSFGIILSFIILFTMLAVLWLKNYIQGQLKKIFQNNNVVKDS